MRTLLALCLLTAIPGALSAELLPEALGEFERQELETSAPAEPELFAELGFEESESATYATDDGRSVDITATRFYDDTGAFSAFYELRDAGGRAAEYGKRAWENPDGTTLIQLGNYLVRMKGDAPVDEHVELMLAFFPRVRVTADPPVWAYTPVDQPKTGSERHVLGPIGLERVAPEIPPSVAGFHFGAEAYYGVYPSEAGDQRLLMMSYPTPQMAREQVEKFYDLDGVVAKRSGPMIGVAIDPPSPDQAQRLLSRVRYEAEVTPDYVEPKRHDRVDLLLIDIFILCGILIGLCVIGGIAVAGGRIVAGKMAPNSLFAAPEGDGMTKLELDEATRTRGRS